MTAVRTRAAAAPPGPPVPSQLAVPAELGAGLAELVHLLAGEIHADGIHDTRVAGLNVVRASRSGLEFDPCLQNPALCVMAQGSKTVLLNGEAYSYDPSKFLVFSYDLPIKAFVTQATEREPYLALRMAIDPLEVADLLVRQPLAVSEATSRGLQMATMTGEMLDAVLRLVRLTSSRENVGLLASFARQEILFRILRSPAGAQLAQLGLGESQSGRIYKAVRWVTANFSQRLRMQELADHVHMSPSSLHHHFRNVTAMSPLQYQKHLRLQEARRLMLADGLDASSAAHAVGYESASHFSREYTRYFGTPPSRHIRHLREAREAGAPAPTSAAPMDPGKS